MMSFLILCITSIIAVNAIKTEVDRVDRVNRHIIILIFLLLVLLFYLVGQLIHESTFESADYGKSLPFESAANLQVSIAFGIMIYGKSNQHINETISDFSRLMDVIYDDSNHIYILHTDYKSDPSIHKYINRYCSSKSNCHSIKSRSITWAGVSVTEMNLALMQAADQFQYADGSKSSWEYYALLGHESVPLRSLKYTKNVLASYPKGTNFINCWKANGHDFYGQHEDINWRLSRVVVDSFEKNILYEPDLNRYVYVFVYTYIYVPICVCMFIYVNTCIC